MRLMVMRGPVAAGPFELSEGDHVAGRSADCPVCLPSKKVSRSHCRFEVRGARLTVVDLGSHNGLIDSNGNKVGTIELPPGGRLQVGDFLVVRGQEEEDLLDVDLDDAEEELVVEEEAPEKNPFGPSLTAVPLAGGAARNPEPLPIFKEEARRTVEPRPPTPVPVAAPAGEPRRPSLFKEEPRKPEPPPLFKPRKEPVAEPASRPEPPPLLKPRRELPPEPAPVRPVEVAPGPSALSHPPAGDAQPSLPPAIRPRGRGGRPDVPLLRASGPPWMLGAAGFGLGALALVVCAGQVGVRAALPPSSESALAETAGIESAALVAARNTDALASGRIDALDVSLVADRAGVREARVTDSRGMVLAPPDKYRINLANRESFQAAATSGLETVVSIGGGTYEVLAPVKVRTDGPVVGWAWVEYDAGAVAAEAPSGTSAAAALVVAALGAAVVLFFGAVILVLRPLGAMAEEAEQVLEGNADTLRPRLGVGAVERLARAFNVLAARVRDLEGANNP